MSITKTILSNPDEFGDRFSAATGSLGSSILTPASGLIDLNGMPLTRTGNKVLVYAANEAVREHCHAALAKNIMDNVAALSAHEEHLCCVAPSGTGRYRAIADQYAYDALRRMASR